MRNKGFEQDVLVACGDQSTGGPEAATLWLTLIKEEGI